MTSNSHHTFVDHLFRHQYGKMVAILSGIFGLSNLGLIEDAIQDTFLHASLKWRQSLPDNPEAWLTLAARNRAIDLFRQIKSQKELQNKVFDAEAERIINEHFLDHEIKDSQLRMIFVACHPAFAREEQIAFALKAISGFSGKEIAAALMQKEETIKKRLTRARKKIQELNIKLEYPLPNEISSRLSGVLQIIYLIFNEGFHSTKSNNLTDKDLCGEALRLCKLLLLKEEFRSGSLYALFALLCFHASRLESKVVNGEIIDLRNQNRTKWHLPLIVLGNNALNKAEDYDDFSLYHLEAFIAAEHVRAIRFENTNWQRILEHYNKMYEIMPADNVLLSRAITYIQLEQFSNAKTDLDNINPGGMNQRNYLVHGTYADYYDKIGKKDKAIKELELAIATCTNDLEKGYLRKKIKELNP